MTAQDLDHVSAALIKAIGIIGSRKKLANIIGTTPDALNGWLNRGVCVPLEYAIEIERITKGNVTWQEAAPHLAHFTKRWSDFFIAHNLLHVKTIRVALSHITHTCHIQTLTEPEVLLTLSDNIKKHGLKHPICVDANNDLIFGEKRLHAYEMLGKKTIPTWRLSLSDLIEGKYSKTELHHLFLFSERVAISLAIEKLLGKRQGRRNSQLIRQSFAEVAGRTDSLIADLLNFGNRQTYKQAKKVFQYGSHELVDAVDHERLAVSAASLLTQLPIHHQKHILTYSNKEITAFVRHIRNQKHLKNKLTSMEKSLCENMQKFTQIFGSARQEKK